MPNKKNYPDKGKREIQIRLSIYVDGRFEDIESDLEVMGFAHEVAKEACNHLSKKLGRDVNFQVYEAEEEVF
jgi:hypothetical protein